MDLESAARAIEIVSTKRAANSPPDLITFASSLNAAEPSRTHHAYEPNDV